MSDYIDTREGWREVSQEEFIPFAGDRFTGYINGQARYYVREEPVPALPTEPGSVIVWQNAAYLPQVAQLDAGEMRLGWWALDDDGVGRWMTPKRLLEQIDGCSWVPLEPRAVTAKAVLDRLSDLVPVEGEALNRVLDEFGVSS